MLLENDSDRRFTQVCHKSSIKKKNNAVSVKCNRVRQPYTRAVATLFLISEFSKKRALGTPGESSGYKFSLPRAQIQPRIHTQFSSVAQILCDPMDCGTPGLPVHHQSRSLLQLMSIGLVRPSNHLILCQPLLLLPSIFSSIRVFSKESVLHIR